MSGFDLEESLSELLGEEEGGYLFKKDADPTLEDLLRGMAYFGASDLYISVGCPPRMKIQGEMYNVTGKNMIPTKIDDLVMGYKEINSDRLTELERSKELNISLSVRDVGRFRLSAFYQRGTQSLVLRFIPPEIPDIDALDVPQILKKLVLIKRGLMIVTGPTGSGKTTTLASMLNYRNHSRTGHIMTLEDPVEFLFRHKKSVVNQREIGTDTTSLEEALKNALRQAPDVIFIGEIRDQATMGMAMQFAQSGHLCMATLHANNSYNALNRIVGFYPPDQREALYSDLSTSLKAVISQRLIPSISGQRIPAVEVMICNRGIQDLIAKGKIDDIPDRLERNNTDGSQTFENVILEMVRQKRISVADALAYSDSPTNLYWKLNNQGVKFDEEDSDEMVEAGVDIDAVQQGIKSGSENKGGATFNTITLNPSDD